MAKQKPKVSFNHAMIYVRDVARALHFYQDLLGLKTIDVFQYDSRPVYAPLRSPVGTTTSRCITWSAARNCRRSIYSTVLRGEGAGRAL